MCSLEGEPPAEICPVTSHRFLREAPFQEVFRQHLRELFLTISLYCKVAFLLSSSHPPGFHSVPKDQLSPSEQCAGLFLK